MQLTDEQRAAFLAAIKADRTLGNASALRKIGVIGTKAELKALLDEGVLEEAREARGRKIEAVEQVDWEIALDKEHPHGDRSRARLLKAYGGPQFREQVSVDHTGQLEVDSSGLAAAIDRFTALAAAAVRAASRAGADGALAAAAAGGESHARVPVAELASPPDAAAA